MWRSCVVIPGRGHRVPLTEGAVLAQMRSDVSWSLTSENQVEKKKQRIWGPLYVLPRRRPWYLLGTAE